MLVAFSVARGGWSVVPHDLDGHRDLTSRTGWPKDSGSNL